MEFVIAAVVIALLVLYGYTKTPKFKGKQGERKVKLIINRTGETGQKSFHDYRMTYEGKTVQIDHIVVNHNGVFVIETKNYSGKIYGNERALQWKQYLAGGRSVNEFYNPVKQNATHIYALRSFLPKGITPISVVVFVQNNDVKTDAACVIPRKILRYFLAASQGQHLSDDQIYQVVAALQMHYEGDISDKTHIQNINLMKKNIEANICPRCGGTMILRTGTYGNFYGCENYPKCKFTKK